MKFTTTSITIQNKCLLLSVQYIGKEHKISRMILIDCSCFNESYYRKQISFRNLFFFFGCPGSAVRRLSLVAVSKSYSFFALHGILIVVASVIVEQGLSSCGTQAQLPLSMWNLPGRGMEPMSPALAGGFLSTAPPGKFQKAF